MEAGLKQTTRFKHTGYFFSPNGDMVSGVFLHVKEKFLIVLNHHQ